MGGITLRADGRHQQHLGRLHASSASNRLAQLEGVKLFNAIVCRSLVEGGATRNLDSSVQRFYVSKVLTYWREESSEPSVKRVQIEPVER